MKPRHRKIVQALLDLGGTATTREIAKQAGLNTNGVSQSMGWIEGVKEVGMYEGADTRWHYDQPTVLPEQNAQLTLGGIK